MPAQLSIEHDVGIDISPFPAFREKIILGPHRYRADNFWQRYVQDFRFVWPHDFDATFTQNDQTKLFEFTPQFRQHFFDANCWTMLSDFFDDFPELHGDAKKFEPQLITYRNRTMLRGTGTPYYVQSRRKRKRSPTPMPSLPPAPSHVSDEAVGESAKEGTKSAAAVSDTPSQPQTSTMSSSEDHGTECHHDTEGQGDEGRETQVVLHGLLNAMRHNDDSIVDDLLLSFRNGDSAQNLAVNLRENFESLQTRGLMSGVYLEDDVLLEVAKGIGDQSSSELSASSKDG